MAIIRNCAAKYHISSTKSLQIGTVYHYAGVDDKFIGDPQEGSASLEFKPVSKIVQLSEAELGRVVSSNIKMVGGG